jgi:membrane protease YdiL (CAAX protease family)
MARFMSLRERILAAAMLFFLSLLLVFLWVFPTLSTKLDADAADLIEIAISRLIAGVLFLLTILYMDFPLLSFRHLPSGKSLLLSLPALVIAVNNFPIIGLCTGLVHVVKWELLPLLLLSCFATGLFEEAAFRGVIFPLLLRTTTRLVGRRQTSRISPEALAIFLAIFGASAVFALTHALNLLVGASPLSVILQIGYSFLIGGMCAIVLLLTGNILVPTLIHALFNFGGYLIPTLGTGKLWDTPTIVLTVGVSLVILAYFLVLLLKMSKEDIRRVLPMHP